MCLDGIDLFPFNCSSDLSFGRSLDEFFLCFLILFGDVLLIFLVLGDVFDVLYEGILSCCEVVLRVCAFGIIF